MEASSPLAAMRRFPSLPWQRKDSYDLPEFNAAKRPGSGTLSLREQLQRASPYQFDGELRGSSPTTSLVYDFAENLGLQSSPKLVSAQTRTTRRALFAPKHIWERGPTSVNPPSSPDMTRSPSPAPESEAMELDSPLPHKVPFGSKLQMMATVPDEEDEVSNDDSMMDTAPPVSRLVSGPSRPTIVERRMSVPRRPSLSRTRGLSSASLTSRSADSQLPPFRFGGDSFRTREDSEPSLAECFEAGSPQQQARRPTSASGSPGPTGLAPPRPKPRWMLGGPRPGSFANTSRQGPPGRPRKQFRRSLSMFESPGDIMKSAIDEREEPPKVLHAVMDIPEVHEPVLPHCSAKDPTDSIPRISEQTMLAVLDGQFNDQFDHKMVIDCRFEYEYEGGHIDGAVNYNNKELLTRHLFNQPMTGRTLLIFHCEYSVHRAPLMARHIRAEDRSLNAERYPLLTYPEVYILEGGYRGFFEANPPRCVPQDYVAMDDEKHQRTCERELGRLKTRKGLGRAKTFHFGEPQSPCVVDSLSPTPVPGRVNPRSVFENSPLGARSPAKRMASY